MPKPFVGLTGVLLLVLPGLAMVSARAQEVPPPPVVLGYYPSWAGNLPAAKINFGDFTHIVHAFATLRNGAVRGGHFLPSKELTQAAHAAGVKVLLGLGGADSGSQLGKVARDPALEDACIQSLATMVAENGYDGVDVDWEFPGASDMENVVTFVGKLRQALRQTNPDALVTMPLPYTDHEGRHFDGPKLAPLLDFAMIMTYNAHGPWKEDADHYCHAGYNSPLNEASWDKADGDRFSYAKAATYWRGKGFSDRQLVMGIHCFGHGFMVDKLGEKPTVLSPHADIDYRKIPPLLDAGWQRHWDEEAGVPWLHSPEGQPPELISYDDPQSAELKGRWTKEAGLRGIFFWEISADLVQDRNLLVEAARKGFGLPAD